MASSLHLNPSISGYSFRFPSPSPTSACPTTPVELDVDSSLPRPPSRETHLSSSSNRSRRHSWEQQEEKDEERDGGERRRPSASGTFGGESTPRAGGDREREGWEEQEEGRGEGRRESSRDPWEEQDHHHQRSRGQGSWKHHSSSSAFPGINNNNNPSSRPNSPPPPHAPTTYDDVSSIASSQSGWIVPAPDPERSKERSMLDLGGEQSEESEEELEGGEVFGDHREVGGDQRDEEEQEEEEEEERQAREWLAWKAGEKGLGVKEGWKRDRGSKLDRVLGEGAQWASLPLSTYSDVLSGPGLGINVQREVVTSVSPRAEPSHLRPSVNRGPAQAHAVKNSIDSGKQSYLSLQDSDDSTEPFFDSSSNLNHNDSNSNSNYPTSSPSTSSAAPYQPNNSHRESQWQPQTRGSSNLPPVADMSRYDASNSSSSATLSLSSLTPEEKSRLLRRAKKLQDRLGVTLTGDLIAGSLTPPPPVAARRFGGGGRRASDPERMSGSFDGGSGTRRFEPAAAFGSAREEQVVLRSRGKSGGGGLVKRMPSLGGFGRGSTSMQKSSSTPGAGSGYYSPSSDSIATAVQQQHRPRISHRSSLPASPSTSSFRLSLDEEYRSPHPNQYYNNEPLIHTRQSSSSQSQSQTPPTSWTPRTNIPRHHLDRLVQNSSSLSLPSTHRPDDQAFDRSSMISTTSSKRRYSIDSPVEDFSVLPRSPPTQEFLCTSSSASGFKELSEEDVAARRLRKIRLQKIHHLMGGEVPAEQLVDGPGTGSVFLPSPSSSTRPNLTSLPPPFNLPPLLSLPSSLHHSEPPTGPWLEPASIHHHHHHSQPHRSLSTSKLNGLNLGGMDGQWKAKVGRVKEKASEMKPSFSKSASSSGGGNGGGGKKGGRSRSKSDDGAVVGAGETSFLSLGAGELPEVGAGTSKRGLKLNKLFGDTPSPNLYHHTHPSKIASSPSRSLFGSISSANGRERSSSSSNGSGSRNSASTVGSGGSGGGGRENNRVSSASSGDAASLDFLRA